jgi:hypothetical protein
MRPFNFETLATHVYALSAIEQFEQASLGALMIVLAGLIPVLALHHTVATSRAGSNTPTRPTGVPIIGPTDKILTQKHSSQK